MHEETSFLSAEAVKEKLVYIYRLPTDKLSDEDCIKQMHEVLEMNSQYVEIDEHLKRAKSLIENWRHDSEQFSGAGEVLETIVDILLATVV
ncbi:hypothetical protein [Brevibacillus sp. 179-C9.3 HS]|uniref:hypothetical protein n=1 Tax=unclassified Brevibacillus TaxID=2684853 RepID=UPI00399F29B5